MCFGGKKSKPPKVKKAAQPVLPPPPPPPPVPPIEVQPIQDVTPKVQSGADQEFSKKKTTPKSIFQIDLTIPDTGASSSGGSTNTGASTR